ncbi:Na+/H+ antiporter NhaC family protein [Marinicella gelatinilytica]|uniref:Na+/H+ antiporter NhaC family protein n=1 Tax=Marinicella gelatinilytica TaxID=2996017 RepID=UPI0022608F91|nr:Na+/H+ antiporter NhaC family protein [Marinicella gelatinilytica]MCX7545739.1 Na+/H+ antiporter NhaC [Marinicella gelatinilytica]
MQPKSVSFTHALTVFLGVFLIIAAGMFYLDNLLHVALFTALLWVGLHARIMGFRYISQREFMNGAISRALPAIYIFLLIGLLIAALMKSGTVAMLIYYGLDWLKPSLILPVGFILCALMSVVTGTSWGTVGTLGVVLMGMAEAVGLPMYWVAGAVVSGATFGDKMSPVSDTTNLAAMSTETDLYNHIKSMAMTTGPTFVVVLIIFYVAGMQLPVHDSSLQQVAGLQQALSQHFNLNPWFTMWPIVVLVVFSYRRFEPELTMVAAIITGTIIALFVQQESVFNMAQALWSNQPADTGLNSLNQLLGRGGLYSMAWTLLLALLAIAMGGILQSAGFIQALFNGLIKQVKTTGALVSTTLFSGLILVASLGEAYIAIILNSQLFKKIYQKRGLDSSVLSRTVEEGVTLMAGLIPWTTAGAFYAATLGISVMDYAPYALLNLLNPVTAIVFAYLGWSILTTTQLDNNAD